MKNILLGLFIFQLSLSAHAGTCTSQVKIKSLLPRDGGWVHVVAEGVENMDILACGVKNYRGMLFNYNDSSGTLEGKKMLYSILLTAFTTGKTMQLCSYGCDSQHSNYTALNYIDNLK